MVALASSGCTDGDSAGTTLPPTTTKVEECSWCPATGETEETVGGGQADFPAPDLMDRLGSTMAGTAFAVLTEEDVRSDISDICGAGEGGASRRGAADETAGLRAVRLEVPESAPEVASYAQLLEPEADRRCP